MPLRDGANTVALSNGELRKLGISRYAKYRALAWLREAGVIATQHEAFAGQDELRYTGFTPQ